MREGDGKVWRMPEYNVCIEAETSVMAASLRKYQEQVSEQFSLDIFHIGID